MGTENEKILKKEFKKKRTLKKIKANLKYLDYKLKLMERCC